MKKIIINFFVILTLFSFTNSYSKEFCNPEDLSFKLLKIRVDDESNKGNVLFILIKV